MAFLALPLVMPLISTSYSTQNFSYSQFAPYMRRTRIAKNGAFLIKANADSAQDDKPTKLVTFLGKGGSGKTTSAIFAAQHYAKAGLNTCLVIHSQDPTADYLLNCKIGTKPITCNNNFSAVRLETTKMLLEPLNKLKEADSRLNMTQGVLEGVVGEELGVLPGMDSIFSAFALERFLKFFGNKPQGKDQKDKFDVVIYDGISTEETLRMIGATSKSRLYLKYIRNLSEKTDLGRLAGPSLMRLLDEAMNLTGKRSNSNGTSSSEIWNYLEQTLEKGSLIFTEPSKFSCYLVMDPNNTLSINSALRYWGCAIQAGAIVSGALSIGPKMEFVKSTFTPLPSAFIPHLASDFELEEVREVRRLLNQDDKMTIPPSVEFDSVKKSVTLLMPGFDKSEIKLYQFRGGSELLVEAGDQRRVIRLPSQIQGKVSGAKFIERSLVITMR